MSKNETKQTNLFGAFVETEKTTLEFIKVHEEVVNDGDQFSIKMDSVAYNDERDCVTVIDNEKNQALTVYFTQHPHATYESTPNGVRLGRAVQRRIKATVGDAETLCDVITAGDFVLTITHTGSKGRLWTVA